VYWVDKYHVRVRISVPDAVGSHSKCFRLLGAGVSQPIPSCPPGGIPIYITFPFAMVGNGNSWNTVKAASTAATVPDI